VGTLVTLGARSSLCGELMPCQGMTSVMPKTPRNEFGFSR